MLDRIKAITLDLDDTLWPSGPAIAAAEAKLHDWLEKRAPALARALPPPQFALFRRALAAEVPHISHDFTALRHEALRRALTLHGADPALADGAMELFLRERSEVELYPDSEQALERLAKRYRLVALSNGNADLERISVGRFFSCIVNARSAGFAKPDDRIFHAACGKIETSVSEVLHAGDHPDLDVRAALDAGMRAAWINRDRKSWEGSPADYHEFHDLIALCEALGA